MKFWVYKVNKFLVIESDVLLEPCWINPDTKVAAQQVKKPIEKTCA